MNQFAKQTQSQDAEASPSKQSRIISTVLSPAVRLWLRSQVEHVEDLHVKIEGGDRQILSGQVQKVSLSARKAVYQGLHLSQVQLAGEKIRINLGQVLRGQPLRLLEAFPIAGDVLLQEADLNASLQAPLLADALTEFLVTLLQSGSTDLLQSPAPESLNLQNPQIVIGEGYLTLSATLVSLSGNTTPIVIRTGLQLASSHELQLDHPEWLPTMKAKRGLPLADLDGFKLDLGPEVNIRELTLKLGQIMCCGQIMVIPAD